MEYSNRILKAQQFVKDLKNLGSIPIPSEIPPISVPPEVIAFVEENNKKDKDSYNYLTKKIIKKGITTTKGRKKVIKIIESIIKKEKLTEWMDALK